MPGGLNTELTDGFSCPLPQLRGVRLFTSKVKTDMSIRVRNSAKRIVKNSTFTSTITNGRSDAILIGNKIISVQKNGNELRAFYADSTLKELADSIYAMLARKEKSKQTKANIYSPVYGIGGMGIKDRLKQMEIMRKRKAGLLTA